MKKTILQKIIYPTENIEEQELFYRYAGGEVINEGDRLFAGPETLIDFGTYFNSFGIEKWVEYTRVESFRLSINVKGQGIIQLYHAYLENGKTVISELKQIDFFSKEFEKKTIKVPGFRKGLIGFRVGTDNGPFYIKEAYYFTDKTVMDDVNLALTITSYKREDLIAKTVKQLLSLPLLFQWDDIDYGLRNKAPLIIMNGICVWHDALESKISAMYTYYSTRNALIVNGCHDNSLSFPKVMKLLKKE